MDRLTSMEVFVKAVDGGSFAAAAQALGMSAQMAGKHVGALERRIGARLLNRSTRSQSLTEVGRIFYERCRALLADAEAAENVTQSLLAHPRGRLRVTAPVMFGAYSLAPLIAAYLQDHPEVQVDLTLTDRYVDLVDEGYEVAIRLGDLPDSTLIARALRPYRLVACASPAYLARRGEPADPAALAAHECLVYTPASAQPSGEWLFHDGGRPVAARVQGRFHANDVKALLAAALEGFGILLGPEVAVREPLASGRLQPILQDYEAPQRPMHVVYPAHRATPKVRSFVDCVLNAFGGGPA